MASAEAVPDPSPDAEVYAAHWGRVYETDESARTREWHCDFADCRAFIAPYCARAAREGRHRAGRGLRRILVRG
jgi:hypothetical protein